MDLIEATGTRLGILDYEANRVVARAKSTLEFIERKDRSDAAKLALVKYVLTHIIEEVGETIAKSDALMKGIES